MKYLRICLCLVTFLLLLWHAWYRWVFPLLCIETSGDRDFANGIGEIVEDNFHRLAKDIGQSDLILYRLGAYTKSRKKISLDVYVISENANSDWQPILKERIMNLIYDKTIGRCRAQVDIHVRSGSRLIDNFSVQPKPPVIAQPVDDKIN